MKGVKRVCFSPKEMDDLCQAIVKNDLVKFRELLSSYSSMLNKSRHDRLISQVKELFAKAKCHKRNEVTDYLSNFEIVKSGEYLLHAISSGDLHLAELLLVYGVKLNSAEKERNLWTLTYGIKFNTITRIDLVKLLVKHDALDIHVKDSAGKNLLSIFIQHLKKGDHKAVEFTEFLIDCGVSVHEEDENGWSPINYSIQQHKLSIFSILLNKATDLLRNNNSKLYNLLLNAIFFGQKDMVDLLLSKGADLDAKDEKGRSLLQIACENNSEQVIGYLIQKGADVTAVDANGRTAFSMLQPAWMYHEQSVYQMVKEFSKLAFENVLISDSDMSKIVGHEWTLELFETCLTELEEMKATIFYRTYSVYSVLKMSKNIKKLAKLMKNSEFLKKLRENFEKFFNYKSDLRKILEEAVKARKESQLVKSRLAYVFNGHFPDIVIRKVADDLNLEDLPPNSS